MSCFKYRLSMMKDAMLQLQMNIPSLNSKASVTATLKDDEEALMEVETVVSLPKMSFQQKSLLRHGNRRPTYVQQRNDIKISVSLSYLL